MKKQFQLLLTTLLCLLLFPLNAINAQQEPIYVGVLDLDIGNVDAEEAKIVSERLRYYIGTSTLFQLFERGKMTEILTEQGFQNFTGVCDSDECIVQIGKIIGVEKMIAGSIGQVGQTFTLHVRMIDMETAEVEHQSFANSNTIDDVLNSGTSFVINDLIEKITGVSTSNRSSVQSPGQAQEQISTPPGYEPPWIALLTLEGNGVESGEAIAISDRLNILIHETGVFFVIDRAYVEADLTKGGFEITDGCNSFECITQVAKIIGVRKIITGRISKIGTIYSLNLKLWQISDNFGISIKHEINRDIFNGTEELFTSALPSIAYELSAKGLPPQ